MLSRAYEWPLQAKVAESSLARRVLLSPPTACRSTPITTTGLPFAIHCDSVGATVQIVT
jgi:hypothetical protein